MRGLFGRSIFSRVDQSAGGKRALHGIPYLPEETRIGKLLYLPFLRMVIRFRTNPMRQMQVVLVSNVRLRSENPSHYFGFVPETKALLSSRHGFGSISDVAELFDQFPFESYSPFELGRQKAESSRHREGVHQAGQANEAGCLLGVASEAHLWPFVFVATNSQCSHLRSFLKY